MKVGWSQLVCTPRDDALDVLSAEWGAFIGEPYKPLIFSVFGDMFYESPTGVYWLDLGSRQISRVADTSQQFHSLLSSSQVEEWFLPPLVEQLYAAGKIPAPGFCYSAVVLPIFEEGKYTVSNLNPVPAEEHFAYTASVHQQVASLPTGAKVRVVVTE